MMQGSDTYNAWNPGINSKIPSSLLPATTLFRPECSSVDYRAAKELSDFSGLKPVELVSFQVERLIVHDLLVRVTADLSVPDGPNYEDLGISLRSMVHTIYSRYVVPDLDRFQVEFDKIRSDCGALIQEELEAYLFPPIAVDAKADKPSLLARWFARQTKPKKTGDNDARELKAIAYWKSQLNDQSDLLQHSCLQALIRVVSAIVAHRGAMIHQPELVASIAINMALNKYGGERITTIVEPVFKRAVEQEGYRWLPIQKHPVVMNVKGASASGKSTIRPQQRQLAGSLGIPWEDFALISPDYWRKYLLDYESLDEDYKYAAMLTGQELEIIDKKLDRYMAHKAQRNQITHLLIDRFRFDSFSVDAGKSKDSKLLSRFGDQIYLFFMVTPPAETVVRAWERGKTTGRYKAVDDLLYHKEAFTGMPALFLSWVLSADKEVHFEFLNNDVPKGELPRTAAFGSNQLMTILDVDLMLNIDRYRNVNIEAESADEVLIDKPGKEAAFLLRCIASISEVRFLEPDSRQFYAVFKSGELVFIDKARMPERTDGGIVAQLLASHQRSDSYSDVLPAMNDLSKARQITIGNWH